MSLKYNWRDILNDAQAINWALNNVSVKSFDNEPEDITKL